MNAPASQHTGTQAAPIMAHMEGKTEMITTIDGYAPATIEVPTTLVLALIADIEAIHEDMHALGAAADGVEEEHSRPGTYAGALRDAALDAAGEWRPRGMPAYRALTALVGDLAGVDPTEGADAA